MRNLHLQCSFALIAVLLSASCSSVPVAGGYVGVGGGGSRLDIDMGTTDINFVDDQSSAVKILGGVDVHERIGLEVFYADFGEGQLSTGQTVGYTAVGMDSVLYLLPGHLRSNTNQRQGLSVFGKLGVASIDNETDVQLIQENALNLSTGIAAEYGFNAGLGLRASVEALDADVQNIQLSLLYRFPFGDQSSRRKIPLTGPSLTETTGTNAPGDNSVQPDETVVSAEEGIGKDQTLILDPIPVVSSPAGTTESTDLISESTANNDAEIPPATPSNTIADNLASTTSETSESSSEATQPAPLPADGLIIDPLPTSVAANTVSDNSDSDPLPSAELPSAPTPETPSLMVEVMSGSDQEQIEKEAKASVNRKPVVSTADTQVTPPAAEPVKTECESSSTRLNVDESGCVTVAGYLESINFEDGTAVLTETAKNTLDEAAAHLLEDPLLRYSVVTVPAQGPDKDFSNFLAKRRTLAVIRYLIAQDIVGSRLKAGIPDATTLPVEKRDISRSWVVFLPLK